MNGITITTPHPKPVLVSVPVGKPGPPGPPGADALWESMTQAEYDAMELAGTADPNTLYIIVP